MKYIKLDLLTLLIGLFIFSSCEKKGTIGLDIDPQDSIKSIFTDTITINAVTVAEDSVATSGISQNPLGFIKDPVFGNTEANLALGLTLPSAGYTFGTNPTLDSAVLVLKYGDEFYGDSINSNYTVNVHQLKTVYNAGKTHYNKTAWGDYSGDEVIGSLGNIKRFAWNDSTSIMAIVKAGPDVRTAVAPQIRIPISGDFIRDHFLNANADNFKNATTFADFIKGLYVTINKTQTTGNGGIIFVNLQSTVSALEIYYKSTNTSGAIDTNVASFTAVGASEIKQENNYDADIATQLADASKSYSQVYVQPMGRLRAKLNFPYIKKLKEIGNISVNKAELLIPIQSGSDNPLKPAPRLTLYQLDIAGQRKAVPDNAIGVDNRYLDERVFGGFYNSTTKTYSLNITSYIQDLISKPIVQYDTFIAPIDLPLTGRSNITPAANTAARAILGGPDAVSRIKLKLTYTKPN